MDEWSRAVAVAKVLAGGKPDANAALAEKMRAARQARRYGPTGPWW